MNACTPADRKSALLGLFVVALCAALGVTSVQAQSPKIEQNVEGPTDRSDTDESLGRAGSLQEQKNAKLESASRAASRPITNRADKPQDDSSAVGLQAGGGSDALAAHHDVDNQGAKSKSSKTEENAGGSDPDSDAAASDGGGAFATHQDDNDQASKSDGSDGNGGCADLDENAETNDGSHTAAASQGDDDQQAKSDGCDDDDDSAVPETNTDNDELAQAEDDPSHPGVQLFWNHYSDSDHNNVETESLLTTRAVSDFLLATYRLNSVQASDRYGSERTIKTSLSLHGNLSEELSYAAALGDVWNGEQLNLIGSAQGALNINDLSITGHVSRDTIDTSAQAIRLDLRQTDFSIDASDSITDHLTWDLEAHRTHYTDGNRANQLNFTPKYNLPFSEGKLSIGYQFSYAAFAAAESNNGYWSPQLLLSHEALFQWTFDSENFYGKLELAGGYQTVKTSSSGAVAVTNNYGGGSGYDVTASSTLGMRPTTNTRIEYSLSREQSVGFCSTSSGVKFRYDF